MHGIVILCATMPIYITMSYITTQLAITNPTHHDLIPFYSEFAVYTIPVILIVAIIICAITRPDYDLLFKRLALMFFLKGVAQILTITPQPDGVEECIGNSIWQLNYCADMMFSGHTATVYLLLYKFKYRYFLAFFMGFELVMANWHYMVDIFIAFIVSYAIEKKLYSESYL